MAPSLFIHSQPDHVDRTHWQVRCWTVDLSIVIHLGMEKALPMFALAAACLVSTAIVFGILCGNMIRARRLSSFDLHGSLSDTASSIGRIERMQREQEEELEQYPIYAYQSPNRDSLQLPASTMNNYIE